MTTATASDNEMYTTGQAAGLLGVPAWRVIYLIDRGVLPEVRRTGILRAWSRADVERARQILARGRVSA